MTTTDHLHYWRDTAAQDWDTVQAMQKLNPRAALVFAHWTLEKLSKALWVRAHHGALPPVSDDVAVLLAHTSVALTAAQTAFAARLKAFHDDVVASDPARPAPQFEAQETALTLVKQAAELRQQLLATLPEAAA